MDREHESAKHTTSSYQPIYDGKDLHLTVTNPCVSSLLVSSCSVSSRIQIVRTVTGLLYEIHKVRVLSEFSYKSMKIKLRYCSYNVKHKSFTNLLIVHSRLPLNISFLLCNSTLRYNTYDFNCRQYI